MVDFRHGECLKLNICDLLDFFFFFIVIIVTYFAALHATEREEDRWGEGIITYRTLSDITYDTAIYISYSNLRYIQVFNVIN